MNTSVVVGKRDFSGPVGLLGGTGWSVERLSWTAVGGCERAVLVARSERGPAGLWAMAELLRCPLRVTHKGRPAWWGYVSAVEVYVDGRVVRWDLDKMANSIAVNYQVAGFTPWAGMRVTTGFQQNSASVFTYGEKQRVYSGGAMSVEQASAYRSNLLAQHGLPEITAGGRRRLGTGGRLGTGRRQSTGGGDYAVVEARGWWETTAWRYYEDVRGQEMNTRAGVEFAFGNLATQEKVAQSVRSADDWSTQEVWVNVAARGAADTLTLSVQGDTAGQPDGVTLASASVSAAELGYGLEWRRFVLNTAVNLTAGVDYWFVLARSGAVDPLNYYLVGLDGQGHYASGVLAVWDGVIWVVTLADLNFMLVGQEETSTHLARMLGSAYGGQFLTGVRVDLASGASWPMYRDGSKLAKEELETGLKFGTAGGVRLLANVDERRVARIYGQPAASTARVLVDENGLLRGLDGELLELHEASQEVPTPAGQWARVLGPGGPLWIESVEWDGERLLVNGI